MRAVLVVALIAFVAAQPAVPSPSPSVTQTGTPSTSPQSVSVTPSPTSSPVSVSVTPTPTASPVSISVSSSPVSVSVTSSPGQGRWCERDACTAGSCNTLAGGRCCSGFCVGVQFLPANIAIGGACDSTNGCATCEAGLSCVSSVCIATGIGFNCMTSGSLTSCTLTSDCVNGLTCLTSGKCGFANLGVGAACNANNAQCYSGLTCTNNVCTAVAAAGACTTANQPYDPSSGSFATPNYLHGACISGYWCDGAVTGTCVAKIATGTACGLSGASSPSCVSGLCNAGFCAAKASVAAQGACTSDLACTSGFCSGTASGNACQATVAQGARCTDSNFNSQSNYLLGCSGGTCTANNKWCNSGLICSMYDGVRPQCMPGAVAPGGVCNNNDQCSSQSSFGCLNGGVAGAAGVCSGSSAGAPCIVGNSTGGSNFQGWCGSYGGQSCGCYGGASFNAAGSYQCTPATTATVNPCASAVADAQAASYTAGYAQASFNAMIVLGSGSGVSTVIKSQCCTWCSGGSSITLSGGSVNRFAAVLGKSIDCTAGTLGAAWSGTTLTNICAGSSSTTGQSVALPGATFLGICKAVTGAASSVVPSLALLVAIVASSLALFL